MTQIKPVTVCIPTRNRVGSLTNCVASCRLLLPMLHEVIVMDDASSPPIPKEWLNEPRLSGIPIRLLRQETNLGNGAARNTIIREASSPFILCLDDDTIILSLAPIEEALRIHANDPDVAAVAFAQANIEGAAWQAGAQPAPVDYRCETSAFIGFGVLIRKTHFMEVGGYKTSFLFYGEEKELCLRLFARGRKIVYDSSLRIAHIPDGAGRDMIRYVRFYTRNDCYAAVYNYPWFVALPLVLYRILKYPYVIRKMGHSDFRGFLWIAREVFTNRFELAAHRRAVSWKVFKAWRGLWKNPKPYVAPR